MDTENLHKLLEAYDELQGEYALLKPIYEKAEKGGWGYESYYAEADEIAADLNEQARDLLEQFVAELSPWLRFPTDPPTKRDYWETELRP